MVKQALRIIVLLFVAATSLAARASTGNPPGGDAPARAVANGFIDAWNRHDMNAFGALFADDADFVNAIGVWLRGRTEIQKHHEIIHATRMKTSHLSALETEVRSLRPDVAIVHVRWELTGQTGQDGAPLPTRQGILVHIVAKTGDQWLITSSQNTDISPIPGPPGAR
jgi:uncharacterized protein (TIGR02246 family)